jgi:signal transduction histidine kinase/CheY-like chemotaxis protein
VDPVSREGAAPGLAPTPAPVEDAVGDRVRLVEIGMVAVFFSCVVFAIVRFCVEKVTGLATPWWGNALGAVVIACLYLWFRRNPYPRATVAVHVTAAAATIALLIPTAYGMSGSKWWISLVGFSALLMARQREAILWAAISLVLVPVTALVEPYIVVQGSIGEPPIELALSTFFYVALLLGMTWAFRRVANRRAHALIEAAVSLDRANRVRNRFLAHVSHELRTPLHGVIAMTDLADIGEASDVVHEQIRAAQQSARVLLGLLNNILDITRAETDGLEISVQEFALHATLTDVLRPLAAQAKARGIVMTATAQANLPVVRRGDRVRLGQIVMNLVSNALKFTQEGAVHVRLRADESVPDGIAIEVIDTGRGIPPEQLEAIFEPFAQSQVADAHNQSGTGLGLAIVRQIVHAMDGRVDVTSTVGRGSSFTVALSLPSVEPKRMGGEDLLASGASERPPAMASGRNPLEVLVCEDDPVNQKVLRAMLDLGGHRTTIVADGMHAWDAIVSGDFELLVTDVEVPGLDGLTLTRRIRDRERDEARARLPIIAATAHVGEAEQHRLIDAGVDAHLPKPFAVAELMRAIEAAVRATRALD